MHRPSPPPPVAPPLVAPPIAEQALPPSADPISPEPARPFLGRVIRDIKIGGACLLLGWIVGQTGVLDRHRQASMTYGAAILPTHIEIGEIATSMVDRPSTQQVSLADGLEIPQRLADQVGPSDTSPRPPAAGAAEAVEVPVEASIESQQRVLENASSEDPIVLEPSVDDSLIAQGTSAKTENLACQAEPSSPAMPSLPAMIDKPSMLPSIESLITLTSLSPSAPAKCESGRCPTNIENMESHGTVLAWADTPADAYRMADEQDKLVFIIHVSGNFEIPGFT